MVLQTRSYPGRAHVNGSHHNLTPTQRQLAPDSTRVAVRREVVRIPDDLSVHRGLRSSVVERRDARSTLGSQCSTN